MAEAPLPLASLEIEAAALAEKHNATLSAGRRLLAVRPAHRALEENSNRILERLHEGDPDQVRKYPYTQWLLDNGHVLRATLQQIEKGLPAKYYRQLPTVAAPAGKGRLTRIGALVDEAVEIGRGPVELDRFERFCHAYQSAAPLTIGELWALPTMLRIRLLQHICSTAEEAWRMSRDTGRIEEIAELTSGIAGCITSLRNISAIQWQAFVERLSLVDDILRRDPAAMYARMDFDTRNDYRDTIERTAKASRRTEWEVADAALRLSALAQANARPAREHHVGYFLLDCGLRKLLSDVQVRESAVRKALPARSPRRGLVYVLILAGVAIALCTLFAIWLQGTASVPLLILMTALATIPALTLSANLVNTLLAQLRRPRRLPKLDFSEGIPADHRAIVAVPAMLANREAIDEALHMLELNYLGNGDPSLQYVLLTDYLDAPCENMPEDRRLLDYLVKGVDGLNRRYAVDGEPFVLLHRPRRWNDVAGQWMGWERKRGKLVQFNGLLRGAASGEFEVQRGTLADPRSVRYVITLDADTLLPTGAAKRLVGTMAHPLNSAEINAQTGRIDDGYSIIQPRIEINPATSSASAFARIYAGDVTLDLYTHAVSDVYQDLFDQGIFAGKGIYDVDAFRATVQAKIPENRVLSHDLLEGLCGRAGLATDIVLLEDYPTSLLAHLKRMHRWVRGDWQLLPWLFGCRPSPEAEPFRPGLVGGWQLFDNLRRSLLAPAILALFALGWLFLQVNAWLFTAVVMIAPGLGLILHALAAFRTGTWRWGTARSSLLNILDHAGHDLARWVLLLAFLPVEAAVSLDAIARTIYRLSVSRRNLLEWSTAAEVARDVVAGSEAKFWRRMWPGPAWAGTNAALLLGFQPASLAAAAPLLLLWTVAPALAFRLSRLERRETRPLPAEDEAYLRRVARGTWAFFEQQVGPGTHWLPPDNIQLEPSPQTAQQTSPTNIGFALLSAAAAFDMGYVGTRECVYNLHHSLQSIARLEKYRGHLYNWYSLTDVQPLAPRYVSTVDSGNFVAAMIAVRESLLEIANSPMRLTAVLHGLEDDLGLIQDKLRVLRGHGRAGSPARLLAAVGEIERELQSDLDATRKIRQLADVQVAVLNNALLATIDDEDVGWTNDEIRVFRTYVGNFTRRAAAALNELRELFPWLLWQQPSTRAGSSESSAEVHGDIAPELTNAALAALPDRISAVMARLNAPQSGVKPSVGNELAADVLEELAGASSAIQSLLHDIAGLTDTLAELIGETDFGFLYNRERNLFHVGYRVDTAELDSSYYDLLASEARLASFVAIAKGDVPPKHWIHLGRPLTSIKGLRVLLSWSATSFEYLMPRLLMRTPRFGLIAQSCRGAVKQQRAFGRQHNIPWGVSESGYYHFDQHGRYQYQAFGIPLMGLKWDQGERLVISSYATFLALPFNATETVRNAREIEQLGGRGEFGFFEALDFGAAPIRHRSRPKIVQSYMAHHQGMSLTAIANLVTGDRLIDRFHRDPRIASSEYLLYERLPLRAQTQPLETFEAPLKQAEPVSVAMEYWSLDAGARNITMLANPRLSAFVTPSGGGCLKWRGYAMTRWKPQTDGINGGSLLYINDLERRFSWAAGVGRAGRDYKVICGPDSIEFRDTRHGLLIRQQIVVAPFSDLELRKVSVTNDGNAPRQLMLCAYSEPVLADADADARHPAFSKLFIEDEYLAEQETLIFRRRPRSDNDPPLCLACKVVAQTGYDIRTQFETDRREFIGRGGSREKPAALQDTNPRLRCRAGESLDPIAALGFVVTVPARTTFQCAFVTGTGEDEVEVLRSLDRIGSIQAVNWAIDDAHRHTQQELMLLEVTSEDVRRGSELFGNILAPPRPDPARLFLMFAAVRAQPALWRHGISGDRAIVTVVVNDAVNFHNLEDLVCALAVCQARGVTADIVFLDESDSAYSHPTHDRLQKIIRQYLRRTATNLQFGTYIVPAFSIDEESRSALVLSSQLMLDLRLDDWYQQLARQQRQAPLIPGFLPQPSAPVRRDALAPVDRPRNLLLDNGLGGIDRASAEYVLYLQDGVTTPAPWCNVLANAEFGTLLSESGSSCTWYRNSSEYTLTTWSNDPVLDRPGEAIYIRDEETGLFWSPLPGPARDEEPYLVRHGIGQSRFEHTSEGLHQSTRIFVDAEEPVKFVRLRLQNRWPRARRLTITYAAEWRLGHSGSAAGLHLLPVWDAERSTFFIRNGFSSSFAETHVFLTSSLPAHGVSFDGDEFLGTLRSWNAPAALSAIGLSGRVDPCALPLAAYQVHVSLAEGESCDLHFALGAGRDRERARILTENARLPPEAQTSQRKQKQAWAELLSHCSVETADVALNAMLNRWLPYQVISSRLNGKIGFYQASGGLGFRDQLQDVLAMLHFRPEQTAAHIQRAAAVQFSEGDVLHWWHEEPLRGVRTRCSDDLLWLPYVVSSYIEVTRDFDLLDRIVPFLTGLPLAEGEHERYAEFRHGDETGTVYEHCCRAIDARMTFGRHGLPPIGTGDWNDGLSKVGIKGDGESVWMAWFLIDVCRRFEPVCRLRKDTVRAAAYRRLRLELQKNVEDSWSGDWYVRGYYDDGSVLGGPERSECRIDLNAQTWAVIAGGNAERQAEAMQSASEHLVDEDHRLIKLLAPPFHSGNQDPGYIKAYPPGVRENGGQYTHAAAWALLAAAQAGDRELAVRWLDWLNPLNRSGNRAEVEHYRIEPYVVAGDIYGHPPYTGRGGWSWYTGSAAWIYRVAVESVLGIRRRGNRLFFRPCVPDSWERFTITIRFSAATYRISLHEPGRIGGENTALVEGGKLLSGTALQLADSGEHEVQVFPDVAAWRAWRSNTELMDGSAVHEGSL